MPALFDRRPFRIEHISNNPTSLLVTIDLPAGW
jgi:hypothetical protein